MTHPDTAYAARLRETAVLIALFSILAYQSARYDPAQAERFGLMLLLAPLILLADIVCRRGAGGLLRHPLTLILGAGLGAAALSTILALSPAYALWGSPYRSHGLLALAAGGLLYWAAARAADRLQASLIPALGLAAGPLALLTWIEYLGLDPALAQAARPAATTGNPNFLANWLALAILLLLPSLLAARAGRLGKGLALLLAASALAVTGGRGALLGLLAGAAFLLALWSALTRRRWPLLGLAGLALAASGLYAAGAGRLFALDDPIRPFVWNQGAVLIQRLAEPFVRADGTPDPWAGLRPLAGYGPDNLEFTHTRLTGMQDYTFFIDRFHNLAQDALLMGGLLGLAAQIALYLAALVVGLRALGMLRARAGLVVGLGCLAAGALAGALLAAILAPAEAAGLAYPAAGLGAAAGLVVWAAAQALRPPPGWAPPRLDARAVFLLGALAVVVQHWTTNQVGFTALVTQIPWWVVLGLLAGATNPQPSPEPPATGNVSRLALAPGLFIAASLGTAFPGTAAEFAFGSPLTPPALLGTVMLLAPLLGVERPGWRAAALWAAVWALTAVTCALAGRLLAAGAAGGDDRLLTLAAALPALAGLSAAVVAALAFTEGAPRGRRWAGRAALAGGALVYSLLFTGDALHLVGQSLSVSTGTDVAAAPVALEAAARWLPLETPARVTLIFALLADLGQNQTGLDDAALLAAARAQLAQVMAREPYIHHTKPVSELRAYLGG